MPTAEAITWVMPCQGDDATVACNCTMRWRAADHSVQGWCSSASRSRASTRQLYLSAPTRGCLSLPAVLQCNSRAGGHAYSRHIGRVVSRIYRRKYMAKSRKMKTKKPKVKRKRTRNKVSIVAKRVASAVDILTGAMRDTQRMRVKAAKRTPIDEG